MKAGRGTEEQCSCNYVCFLDTINQNSNAEIFENKSQRLKLFTRRGRRGLVISIQKYRPQTYTLKKRKEEDVCSVATNTSSQLGNQTAWVSNPEAYRMLSVQPGELCFDSLDLNYLLHIGVVRVKRVTACKHCRI